MGLFLQSAILKGSTLSDFTDAMSQVSAEHPEMNLDSACGLYHTYEDATGILFSYEVVGYEPLAKALSEKLGRSVMLLYIYDGDQWGYYLYDKGRRMDAFNPVPDYFTDDESEAENLKGNAETVARHFGVPVASIESYLVRWTEERLENGGKAYPSDAFDYGDCWQMADFMNALHHPYAFESQEEPTAAAPPPTVEIPFDTALITSDLERWIADTYVIWSGREGGNWQLFGGYPKNDENAVILKKMLVSSWNINNLTEGIQTVNLLVSDAANVAPETDGWNFSRGMQLLGVFYLVGYIDRKQMVDYSCTIGKIIQHHFHSWEAFCQSYLAGHAQWCRHTFGSTEAEPDIADRRARYEAYKKMKNGPYRLPWNLPLTPAEAAKAPAGQSASPDYFAQWLAQEEMWIAAYRRKASNMLLLMVMPSVLVVLSAFMAVMGLINGERGVVLLLASMILGVMVGLLVTLPVYGFVMHRLSKGRISRAIKKTTDALEMDAQERETLGMQMLAGLQFSRGHLDYQDKAPHSQTTPARLIVSKDYFYQSGSGMYIILIRSRDIEYIEAGQERKQQGISARTWQSFVLHAVYFYYRSSRERRLEGDKSPDNGMGFFDPAIRDKAFTMIDRQLKSR